MTFPPPPPPGPAGRGRGRRRGSVLVGVGIAAMLIGLTALLLVGVRMWQESSHVADTQRGLDQQLQQVWTQPGPDPAASSFGDASSVQAGSALPGDDSQATGPEVGRTGGTAGSKRSAGTGSGEAVMRLRIPKLGGDWAVVQGVTQADMAGGPGLYPGMAAVGQPGNTGIAGHRWFGVFWDLDQLAPGDRITVTTRSRTYTYQVDSTRIVVPSETWVLGPRPLPGQSPDQSVLTLTTCTPKGQNGHRLVVFSRLVATASR